MSEYKKALIVYDDSPLGTAHMALKRMGRELDAAFDYMTEVRCSDSAVYDVEAWLFFDSLRDIYRVIDTFVDKAREQQKQQTQQTQQAPPPDVNLDALIDRILIRQQYRTPQYVVRSQAMQAIAARLDTALQGDDTTLRSVVSEVITNLYDHVLWQDDAT